METTKRNTNAGYDYPTLNNYYKAISTPIELRLTNRLGYTNDDAKYIFPSTFNLRVNDSGTAKYKWKGGDEVEDEDSDQYTNLSSNYLTFNALD